MNSISIAKMVQKIDIAALSSPYSSECLIAASNDFQAVQAWLMQYSGKKTTFTTYKRESDRLLLWCLYEAGKTLAQLRAEDLTQYILFLAAPPEKWCTSVGNIRVSGHGGGKWRPFLGPLSDSAKYTAIRVVNSLLNYLVDSYYLKANPLKLIKQYSKFNIKLEEYKYNVWSKILNDQEWQALQQTLQTMPENNSAQKDNKMRTQFIFACLYLLGLRISELASSPWNAFKFHQGVWWFFVRGKGDKLGHIPVNDQLLTMVKNYRSYLGKSQLPRETELDNLIISKKTARPLSIKQLYSLIKAIGAQASKKFAVDSISYQKLQALSPHSLRHLSASHQERAGISMNMIQANLRHASLHTTKIYMHADDLARSSAMDKIQLNITTENTIVNKTTELILQISGNNVCTGYALEQLLWVIETKIFKDLQWHRGSMDPKLLAKQYDQTHRYGMALSVKYIINIEVASWDKLKLDLTREAEIRLFKLELKVNQL